MSQAHLSETKHLDHHRHCCFFRIVPGVFPSAAAPPLIALNRTMSTDDGPAPGVPAPLTHVLLITLALLPLVVPVPTNANIVLTAAAAVLCGSWRSIKPEPPTETMTQKARMDTAAAHPPGQASRLGCSHRSAGRSPALRYRLPPCRTL